VKKLIPLIICLILGTFFITYSQKGATKPTNSNPHLQSSPGCPLAVSIQDNIPAAVCSELLKTLVAVTGTCTDTTAVRYRWSSNIGGVFSTSRTTTFNLPEFFITTPVTFTVWVVEGSDSLSANYTISVKPRPNSPTLTPFGTIVLCDNNPVTLTSSACTGGSTTIWSSGASGVSTINVPAIGGTYFSVACYKNGCISDSTAAAALITGIISSPPTTTNKVICEGTTITAGNGLQANLVNCNNGYGGTYAYTGGTVGYDNGLINNGGVNPAVVVPSTNGIVKKVSISITWRKQKGGFQNDCGVGDTQTWPYHNETQFRVKSPSGKIITLVNTNTYGGSNNPTVTTVFEDGASPVNFYSPPVSGTFAPSQPLSGFIGENPTGTWTLLPYDAVWKDPLCVSGFSVTFSDAQNGSLTWWDAPTGGNQVGTGSEYIPIATTAGTYTYYAQAQCVKGCPSVRTATTLTIQPTPIAPTISVSVPEINSVRSICSGESVTLTATGCNNGGTVRWNSSYNGTNFATGATYTFTPAGGNSVNVTHPFTAACEGSNLCRSVNSASLSVVVKYKPNQPTISSPGTSICANSSIILTAFGCSGGTLGWTGNRSGSSISFNLTNAVSIKTACTINGCTSDSSSVYTITPLPKPSTLTVNASQVQALCYGSSVTLTASACVGTIKWTGNLSGSPLTVTPLSSKNYKASCLSSNGCSSDSSTALNVIVLPKTKPVITGNSFVCGATFNTLIATGCSGANETVVWRNDSIGTNYSETIVQTKTFRAVCIRNGYCVSDSSDIFTVQYRIKPSQPTITPPQNTTICQGTSVSLTTTACTGGTSNWTGGLSGQTINVSPNTNKSYKVACVINGCVSDSSLAVSLTVKAKPSQPTINQLNPIICAGQNTILSIVTVNGASYNWTGGLTGSSVSVSPSVTKTYKVASIVNGCVSDSANVIVIVNSLPVAPSITLGGEVCTNTLPAKVWDNLISTPSGCSVNALINNSSDDFFAVIQEPTLVKIAKFNSSGSVLWSRYLNTSPLSGTPYINSAVQTSDGGYLLGGSIISLLMFGDANFLTKVNSGSGASTSDFWILKIDANGITQWSKNFGGDNKDELSKIEKTSDGGYLLSGVTNSSQGYDVSEIGRFNDDFWVVKIDLNGNKIWDKRYRPTNSLGDVSALKSVKQATDGGFLLSTNSNINSTGQGYSIKYYVFKINSSGIKQWENAYENISLKNCYLRSVEKTTDNGYILVGEDSQSSNPNFDDIFVIKINAGGVRQWSKVFATPSSDGIRVIKAIPNESNFLIGGFSGGNGGDRTELSRGSDDIWLIKIKPDGSKIWDKSIGGSALDYVFDLDFDLDGKIILGGFSSSSASGDKTINGPGAWFVKIASSCPANVSSTICKGDSVSLKASNCIGTINWSNGSVGTTLIAKPIVTTNYTATCTNSYGCISPLSAVFTVTVSTPPTPTITPPANSTICQGSNIALSATGCTGGTFAWSGGLTGTSITVSPSITKAYKVACTLNTCVSDSSSAVTITVNSSSVFSLNSNKNSICLGDSATLSISGCNGTISWSNGAVTSVIKVSPTANNSYTATCTVGLCSFNQSANIIVLSTPNVTASGILQCGQAVTLTANNVPVGSSIQWRKDGVDILGAINNTLSINNAGSYDFTSYKVESPVFVGNSSFNESVKFINEITGFVGNNEGIFKTNDGGTTWIKVYTSSKSVKCISFINSLVGWAVGNQGLVLKTVDGGNNWILGSIITPYALYKVVFKDSNNGLIVGDFGSIFTTSNGGNTWIAISTFNIALYPTFTSTIFVPNTLNIWAVGAQHPNGFIAKSIDNGLNWSQVSVPVFVNKGFGVSAKLNDIVFTTSNNGWVVADDGLYRTTDGGTTWQIQSTGVIGVLAAIQFVSSQVGFIVGNSNTTLLKTVDGGNTWRSLNTSAYANSLSFISDKLGWVTYNSTIVKYAVPQCSTIPKVMLNICCSTFETIKSGSWTDPTTWSCNRIPTAIDDIFINTGHTITDNGNTIHAKTLNYRGGILQLSTTTNFILR
jgi:photosystem II stability/assembly factor-like uncharacterized protein